LDIFNYYCPNAFGCVIIKLARVCALLSRANKAIGFLLQTFHCLCFKTSLHFLGKSKSEPKQEAAKQYPTLGGNWLLLFSSFVTLSIGIQIPKI